ncbi:hypothetical protein CEF21_00225 [Bacillus sp. FJAT-42376]|uniref:hypothetical protein n=1 Tax=Bacillus sp. FJAT-42376 TaxID=2014076 RepID=UPI000F5114EA|nr:hypothetical protein [Bacillus sp. FJAT-42376]AZB40896.1 hypothetical protein CEF21_00225 [Bacillus sp. FJAT-42376]
MTALNKPRWGWMILLSAIILGSNTLIYRIPNVVSIMTPAAAIGSLLDCILIFPLAAYFLIIRRRYSLRWIVPVIIAGLAASWLIIPIEYIDQFLYLKYLPAAGITVLIGLEVFIMTKVLLKAAAILKEYRSRPGTSFYERMEKAVSKEMKPSRLLSILMSEVALMYYGLFSWKKKPVQAPNLFTFHKKTSVIAFNIMLIHALLIESIGFHILLHSWNPVLSWILLILNIYTILLFLAEMQSFRLTPFAITDQELHLQVGVMKRLTVNLKDILAVSYYEKPENAGDSRVFDGMPKEFAEEDPAIVIEFTHPVEAKLLYGFTKKVTKAHIRPDEPQLFYEALSRKLESNQP